MFENAKSYLTLQIKSLQRARSIIRKRHISTHLDVTGKIIACKTLMKLLFKLYSANINLTSHYPKFTIFYL